MFFYVTHHSPWIFELKYGWNKNGTLENCSKTVNIFLDHPVLTWKFLYTHLDTGELILGIWFFFYLEQFSGVKSFCQPRHFDLGTQFCNFYTNDSRQNLILTIWVYLFCWKFDMLIPNYSVIRKVNIFNFDRFRAIFSGTIFFVTRQVLPWN